MDTEKPSDRQPIKGGRLTHWISLFLDYFDAKSAVDGRGVLREASSPFHRPTIPDRHNTDRYVHL
jgi:hypothetical protein